MAECFGKRKYHGVQEAEKAIARMFFKDYRLKIGDLHWYHCPHCTHYHIGHKEYYEQKQANKPVNQDDPRE